MNEVKPSRLPDDLRSGILHFGPGAFHRAHQAVYTQDAIAASGGDWGIEVVSMGRTTMADSLVGQGGYTLIEQYADGPRFRQINVIRQEWNLKTQADAIADRMADPTIHVVSSTVTEKGYCADFSARKLDRSHPGILHDWKESDAPTTLLGILALGLRKRGVAKASGLTIISCDNLTDNSVLLKTVLLEFIEHNDADLANWVQENCAFPNTMVDRITPAVSGRARLLCQQVKGHQGGVVETEPFTQWVIEDNFSGPVPDWQSAGALFVADVEPYELMKLRMLNGAHSLIAYLGTVTGLKAVRDVMAKPDLKTLVHKHMMSAAQTLAPLKDISIDTYANELIVRFENPAIEHLCSQIAKDGSQKMPQRIFAPALNLLDKGLSFETFALATAMWIRHIELATTNGQAPDGLPLDDPMQQELTALVAQHQGDAETLVRSFSTLPSLAKSDLFNHPDWVRDVATHLTNAHKQSVLLASITGDFRSR